MSCHKDLLPITSRPGPGSVPGTHWLQSQVDFISHQTIKWVERWVSKQSELAGILGGTDTLDDRISNAVGVSIKIVTVLSSHCVGHTHNNVTPRPGPAPVCLALPLACFDILPNVFCERRARVLLTCNPWPGPFSTDDHWWGPHRHGVVKRETQPWLSGPDAHCLVVTSPGPRLAPNSSSQTNPAGPDAHRVANDQFTWEARELSSR